METPEYLAAKKVIEKDYASKLFEAEVGFCPALHNDYVKAIQFLNTVYGII